jgi:ANTAR domain
VPDAARVDFTRPLLPREGGGPPVPDLDPSHLAYVVRQLAAGAEWPSTVAAVTTFAPSVVGCEWASVYRTTLDGTVLADAPQERDPLRAVDRAMTRAGEGPASAAMRESTPVHIDDLWLDRRWTDVCRQIAAATPVRSAFIVGLQALPAPRTALAFYDSRTGYFAGPVAAAAQFYAECAAIALRWVRQKEEAESLRLGLHTSRDVSKAIGIVMATHAVSEPQAFQVLRAASGQSHRKLRDVAAEVVRTGVPPDCAPAGGLPAGRSAPTLHRGSDSGPSTTDQLNPATDPVWTG